jgi:hypothetical protein
MHRPPRPLSLSQRIGDWALGLAFLSFFAAIVTHG